MLDFMHDTSVNCHATRQRRVVIGQYHGNWTSICVLFSTLADASNAKHKVSNIVDVRNATRR